MKYHSLILYIIVGCLSSLQGQEKIIINNIILEGNKHTRDYVVLQELDLSLHDTIYFHELSEVLLRNKKRLLSTGLFNIVNTNIKNWNTQTGRLDVVFELQENWYLYPAIIWEYADRSFNVWWKEHRFNFARTNYGVRLDHLNLTGNKDLLNFKFQRGYTQKYELIYNYPYFLSNWGLGSSIFYSTNKELGYKTENNNTLFFKHPKEKTVLSRFRTGMVLSNRGDAFSHHSFKLEYHSNSVIDTVAKSLNTDYFLEGKSNIKFFLADYSYFYDHRIFPTYPEGGYAFFAQLKKEGFGIFNEFNNLSLSLAFEQHFKLSKGLIFSSKLKGKSNLIRNKIAYANNTALGYGEEVRGYELYVIDGTDFLLHKSDLKLKLFHRIYDWGRFMPINQLDLMTVDLWLRSSVDWGFVNEPNYSQTNALTNTVLYGAGIGLDLLIYNNYKFSIEYNINKLGEGGTFFQAAFFL